MEIIKRKEVMLLLQIHPGDITICTYDKRRETGGKRKTYLQVMLTGYSEEGNQQRHREDETSNEASQRVNKQPNFKANATTNICCKNGDTITIHPCLIEFYNGKQVSL